MTFPFMDHNSREISPGIGVVTRGGIPSGVPSHSREVTIDEASTSTQSTLHDMHYAPDTNQTLDQRRSKNIAPESARNPRKTGRRPRASQPGVDDFPPPSFLRSRSNSGDPAHKDVHETVYYFSNSLTPITRPNDFTLFSDVGRTTMIVKWMRFYNYYPNWPKEIDKPRRDQLKEHLSLPPNHGQRLGSFIINKFNMFLKSGLVAQNNSTNVTYCGFTDTWLSQKWDGVMEKPQEDSRRETQSPAPRLLPKRPTSDPIPQDPKRHKSVSEGEPIESSQSSTIRSTFAARSLVESSRTYRSVYGPFGELSEPSVGEANRRMPVSEGGTTNSIQPSNNNTKPVSIHIQPEEQPHSKPSAAIDTSKSLPANTHTNPVHEDESQRLPRASNQLPDHHTLSAELEKVLQGTTGSKDATLSQKSTTKQDTYFGQLRGLKKEERACKSRLRVIVEEDSAIRNAYERTWEQYEDLKDELNKYRQTFAKAQMRDRATVAPTPNGISDTVLQQSLRKAREELENNDWQQSKEAQRQQLERQIEVQQAEKLRLKASLRKGKAEAKEIREKIKRVEDLRARDQRIFASLDVFLGKFKYRRDSGTVSPVESLPDSIFSDSSIFEEEEDDDD